MDGENKLHLVPEFNTCGFYTIEDANAVQFAEISCSGTVSNLFSRPKQIPHVQVDLPVIATLAHAYAVSGRRAEAYKLLNELQVRATQQYVSHYYMAVIYAGLGMSDQAFEHLEKAIEERQPYLTLLSIEPVFANLRSDPRFHNLLRRIGLRS